MENRLRELEEKLKKSEDQRQKLKDNLVRSFLASERQTKTDHALVWVKKLCQSLSQISNMTIILYENAEILQGKGHKHARASTPTCTAPGGRRKEGQRVVSAQVGKAGASVAA